MAKVIFVFRVSLDRDIYRDIEIAGSRSLASLAEFIIDAFDFDFDHCYGFYSKTKGRYYDSEEKYELFADMDEGGTGTPPAKSVEKTKIETVFFKGKKMLFFFDYGDSWEFIAKCKKTMPPVKKIQYPRITLSKGEAPEQYPDYEDYE